MNINPDKVLRAIDMLKCAADMLLHGAEIQGAEGLCAAECIKAAADLQASVQIAGLTHRTFHTTGSLQ